MRVLIANEAYESDLLNHGDLAMLQAAVRRLCRLWRDTRVWVATEQPEALRGALPEATPIGATDFVHWRRFYFDHPFDRLQRRLPPPLARRLASAEASVRDRMPGVFYTVLRARLAWHGQSLAGIDSYFQAFDAADLVVVAGGGHFVQGYERHAEVILSVLQAAIRRGKPTAMLSLGIAPMADPALAALMAEVLPRVDLLAVREGLAALPLLHRLGVSPDRILVTGDDAVELAYRARPAHAGRAIGANLRVAPYSEVENAAVAAVGEALREAAGRLATVLLPVPISLDASGYDPAAIRVLLGGGVADGGEAIDSPAKVVDQVGRCRVVVTGSYHAGVFALAQGIPVVALARSAYYRHKFLGLADQFGRGCEVVPLDPLPRRAQLVNAIERAWHTAEDVRAPLLAAARRQIEASHEAYRRLGELRRPHLVGRVA